MLAAAPQHAPILDAFLKARGDLSALLTQFPLPDLLAFAADPAMQKHIQDLATLAHAGLVLRAAQAREKAIAHLESAADASDSPIERRRTAFALFRATAAPLVPLHAARSHADRPKPPTPTPRFLPDPARSAQQLLDALTHALSANDTPEPNSGLATLLACSTPHFAVSPAINKPAEPLAGDSTHLRLKVLRTTPVVELITSSQSWHLSEPNAAQGHIPPCHDDPCSDGSSCAPRSGYHEPRSGCHDPAGSAARVVSAPDQVSLTSECPDPAGSAARVVPAGEAAQVSPNSGCHDPAGSAARVVPAGEADEGRGPPCHDDPCSGGSSCAPRSECPDSAGSAARVVSVTNSASVSPRSSASFSPSGGEGASPPGEADEGPLLPQVGRHSAPTSSLLSPTSRDREGAFRSLHAEYPDPASAPRAASGAPPPTTPTPPETTTIRRGFATKRGPIQARFHFARPDPTSAWRLARIDFSRPRTC